MSYTIKSEEVISYGPDNLKDFKVYGFEWIDNLHFSQKPDKFLKHKAAQYVAVVRERFLEAGWRGDGDIELIWLPPFVFPFSLRIPPEGVVVWHVKQEEDGISFLLSPIALPFEEFQNR